MTNTFQKEIRRTGNNSKTLVQKEIQWKFKTRNTTEHLSNPKPVIQAYFQSGIYRIQCQDCNRKYIRQKERSFYQRYKEHYQDFKTGNNTSIFARHLIENNYSIGRIANVMNAVHL